jgi:hypothetical protein
MIQTLLNIGRTIHFLSDLIFKENLKNYIIKDTILLPAHSPEIRILANGPSLKDFLQNMTPDNTKEYFVMNDFANYEAFEMLKPRFYVLSDPLFFFDGPYAERGKKALFEIAQKVHWNMNLYVPYRYREEEFMPILFSNKQINIVPFHTIQYIGTESGRMFFYKKGLGNGEFGTVALSAIYISILLGFKKINLYGVDHSFFNGLYMNEKNQLCYKQQHFYSDEQAVIKPFLCHYTGELRSYTIREYLIEKASIFEGHEIMSKFATAMGVKIINHTQGSLIDAYGRD